MRQDLKHENKSNYLKQMAEDLEKIGLEEEDCRDKSNSRRMIYGTKVVW